MATPEIDCQRELLNNLAKALAISFNDMTHLPLM